MHRQLAPHTDVGGTWLLSSCSEPGESNVAERLVALGIQRLQNRGLKEDQLSTLLAIRNPVVFSVDDS